MYQPETHKQIVEDRKRRKKEYRFYTLKYYFQEIRFFLGNILCPEIKNMRKTIEEYRKIIEGDLTLEEMHYQQGVQHMRFKGSQIIGFMTSALYEYVREAPNFVETTFYHEKSGERLVVNIQKSSGKTPYQLLKEAEGERDELKKKLEALENKT